MQVCELVEAIAFRSAGKPDARALSLRASWQGRPTAMADDAAGSPSSEELRHVVLLGVADRESRSVGFHAVDALSKEWDCLLKGPLNKTLPLVQGVFSMAFGHPKQGTEGSASSSPEKLVEPSSFEPSQLLQAPGLEVRSYSGNAGALEFTAVLVNGDVPYTQHMSVVRDVLNATAGNSAVVLVGAATPMLANDEQADDNAAGGVFKVQLAGCDFLGGAIPERRASIESGLIAAFSHYIQALNRRGVLVAADRPTEAALELAACLAGHLGVSSPSAHFEPVPLAIRRAQVDSDLAMMYV